jgi:branched-chain amino acid transport system substrate-binding protein
VDPLGYHLPPFAYANLQVFGQAVDAAKTLDQGKLAEYLRMSTFKTIVGDNQIWSNGEWEQARVLQV